MKYITRTMSITVLPESEPTFSEMATTVLITDEGGGEYVEVKQVGRTDIGKICINPEEWPALKAAIDSMIADCQEVEK
jgi:hypothetical protein